MSQYPNPEVMQLIFYNIVKCDIVNFYPCALHKIETYCTLEQ